MHLLRQEHTFWRCGVHAGDRFDDLGTPFRRAAIPGYYCYNNPNLDVPRRNNLQEPSCYWDCRAVLQWRSRTFGRPVRWSNLPPCCLSFWEMYSLFKPRVLMPEVTCSVYSILALIKTFGCITSDVSRPLPNNVPGPH